MTFPPLSCVVPLDVSVNNEPPLRLRRVDVLSFSYTKPNASYRLKINHYIGVRMVFHTLSQRPPLQILMRYQIYHCLSNDTKSTEFLELIVALQGF